MVTFLLRAFCVSVVVAMLGTASASAQEMTYTTEKGQKFAYKVDITADRNNAKELLEGVVTFTVKGA